jgi:hypothetical protein
MYCFLIDMLQWLQLYLHESKVQGVNFLAGLAMMRCCKANSSNNEAFVTIAFHKGICGWPSMLFGTIALLVNPIAYKKVAKKAR